MANNNHSKNNIVSSFKTAWSGVKEVLILEPAFKYMASVAFIVIVAMLYFPTTRLEKAVLLVMIFSVLGLEIINSVMERFLDFLQPHHDLRVKIIKDLLSAFVLLVSLGSAIIGILVFYPYIFK